MSNKPKQIVPLDSVNFSSNKQEIRKRIRKQPTNMEGLYIFSCSSYSNEKRQPYNVFNDNLNSYWECDYRNNNDYNRLKTSYKEYTKNPYNGDSPSNYQGGGHKTNLFTTIVGEIGNNRKIKGEWIQIQLPEKIYLQSYILTTPPFGSINNFPRKFVVLGSNDGINWTLLDYQQVNDTTQTGQVRKSFSMTPPENYRYYRLIVEQMKKDVERVKLSQWKLFGTMDVYQEEDKDTFIGIYRGMNIRTGGNTVVDDKEQEDKKEPKEDGELNPYTMNFHYTIWGTLLLGSLAGVLLMYSKKKY